MAKGNIDRKTGSRKKKPEDESSLVDEHSDSQEGDGEEIESVVGELVDNDQAGLRTDSVALNPYKETKENTKDKALARRDPLNVYVQETKRFPLLSREEEHDLAVRLVEQGDSDAARRLVEANLRLVVKIAYEYRRAHRNLLDLVQEGNIGLMKAVKKYDPYRGVKLSSYAAWWIRAYMLRFILNNWRLVKIGTTQAQRKLFFNLKKERDRLEQLGFEPDHKMLAESLDVREKDVIEMEKRLSGPDASFDSPLQGQDGESVQTRYDIMSDDDQVMPDEAAAEKQFSELLKEKLSIFEKTLEGRDAVIFQERWLTEDPKTLQQLGDMYSISRERARQLEKRILGKLRVYLEEELGTAVDIGAMKRD